MDSRIEDYLNDKLQTFADFETLDSLIANVQSQHVLLKKQLAEAKAQQSQAEAAADAKAEAAIAAAAAFESQQADIDKRLLEVTRSDTVDGAVEVFERTTDRLRRLNVADGYLTILQRTEQLCQDAKPKSQSSPEDALQAYSQLRAILTHLEVAQDAAEGAAPHLVDYVSSKTSEIRQLLLDSLTSSFETLLKRILWPKPNVAIPDSLLEEWDRTVGRLLVLQKPDIEAAIQRQSSSSKDEQSPIVLLPLQILAKPLEARFHYHFSGSKPTNRLDKPEYFLSHISDILNSHNGFVEDYIQPCLLQHLGDSTLMGYMAYVDATTALITALLPMVRSKVVAMMPQVSSQPVQLSHLIKELMKFDATLQEEWNYSTSSDNVYSQWKGITWDVLTEQGWFDSWIGVEKEFALARYQKIVDEVENSHLDFDSQDAGVTKSTKAALLVKDLLETITTHYRPLYSFNQKLSFLINIQIAILDKFYSRLHSSLEAFLSLSSTIGRTMQGGSAADLANTQGVNGLDRVCRIIGSADLLEKAMRDWSDDVFFLDMWTELQGVTLQKSDRPRSKGADVIESQTQVEARAAELVKASKEGDEDGDVDVEVNGALFDETAAAYAKLRARSETLLVDTVNSNFREALRSYGRSNPWSSLSMPSGGGGASPIGLAPSADLSHALTVMTSQLGFLQKALGSLKLRRVGRQVAGALNVYLYERVLQAHSFSAAGAEQVRADIDSVMSLFEMYIGAGVGSRAMSKCADSVRLLNLRVERQVKPASRIGANSGDEDDDGADAWGSNEEGSAKREVAEVEQGASQGDGLEKGDSNEGGLEDGRMGLQEAERRIFASNESARRALDELGIEYLTESEARQMLQRRVDIQN